MSIDLRSLSRTCGGTGWLDCECGGDLCVCTLNGGIDCPGCEDCRTHDDYDEANEMPSCPRCGEELAPSGTCYECDAVLYAPDCDQCGGPTREGFCPTCQA
jgi:hypothetical protein